MKELIRCNRCIMDNYVDTDIFFNKNGICEYCTNALKNKDMIYFPNEKGKEKLEKILTKVKNDSKHLKYDCVMGISGGLDSSYLLFLGKKWGLRILCVHIDDGFDTDIAKENMCKLQKASEFEIINVKPDLIQYYALLKAYLRAGVPTLSLPQDNILFATVFNYTKQIGIKYFLSGGNFASESINTKSYGTLMGADTINIKAIHKAYGTEPIDKLTFLNIEDYFERDKYGIEILTPLNYIDYNKKYAQQQLSDFCGFLYYGGKHLENIWTAFLHVFWLPKKFNLDLRTNYLSSLIISGQLSRDEALDKIKQPYCDEGTILEYVEIIKKKLNMRQDEFDEIMSSATRKHTDFENYEDNRRKKMEMPDKINQNTRIMIFGAGDWGASALKALENRCDIMGFFDNDESKHYTKYYNKEILPPPGHEKYINDPNIYVIVACKDYKSIIRQLISNNVKDNIFYFDYINTEIIQIID